MTDEDLYKEMLQAELASGMRIVYGYNVPDLPLEQARAAFVDFKAFAEREAARNPRLLKLALAKTGHIGRWGKDFFPNEVAIAKEFDLDLQLHFLESNFYQRQNRADFKMMEEVGALDVGLIYGHFIHTAKRSSTSRWLPVRAWSGIRCRTDVWRRVWQTCRST